MQMKYYRILVDGIDKSGKDIIVDYIDQLSGHKYVVKSRGVLSVIAYSNLYKRNFEYDLTADEYTVTILIDVDEKDWNVRCKLTNEPKINFNENVKAFDEAYNHCKDKIKLLRFNSSKQTPYQIALQILRYMEELNNANESK